MLRIDVNTKRTTKHDVLFPFSYMFVVRLVFTGGPYVMVYVYVMVFMVFVYVMPNLIYVLTFCGFSEKFLAIDVLLPDLLSFFII